MPIKNIAVACQGGGSHAAYAAGALPILLPRFANLQVARAHDQRAALEHGPEELLHLTGISGTSGGAISALLAWFGFLTGGAESARMRLERFWDANCARQPGERLLNDFGQWLGNVMPYDLKFSPYLSPLRDMESFMTRTWPLMTQLWPPLSQWIRAQYFQLRESVEPHVDFTLIAAIGEFCSIPLAIRRWQACDLEARMFDPNAPHQAGIRARQQAIENDIRIKLDAGRWIGEWIGQNKMQDSLLGVAFGAWRQPEIAFEQGALERLSDAVKETTHSIPQLLIGAVDIESGAFVAFSSERAPADAGITLDAVVASASLPWLFEAQSAGALDPETQEPRRMACWDGLFSQNPPIKNFISSLADKSKKPDGLWILQINQDRFDFGKRIAEARGSARSGGELWHRRDTLAGNLSLNQEVAFIEAINQRLDDPGQRFRPHDKPIEVARIVLDGEAVGSAAGKELGMFSKLDRHARLEQALLAHGREQATHFLSLRGYTDRLCDELAHALETMGAHPSPRLRKAFPWLPGRDRIFGGLLAPDVLTIDGTPGSCPDDGAQATLRWHVSDAVVDGRTVRIRGSTRLCGDAAGWRLGETRLLDIEEKAAQAPTLPASPAGEEPGRPAGVPGAGRGDVAHPLGRAPGA